MHETMAFAWANPNGKTPNLMTVPAAPNQLRTDPDLDWVSEGFTPSSESLGCRDAQRGSSNVAPPTAAAAVLADARS